MTDRPTAPWTVARWFNLALCLAVFVGLYVWLGWRGIVAYIVTTIAVTRKKDQP